jgi:transposase
MGLCTSCGGAMSNFRQADRQTGFLLPPSVDEWLPEHHLARFVVEVIEGLDLRAMSGSYRGLGSAPYHPTVLLGLLVYGYATGVFSSRKLERATYDSVAFRFIAANDHPDHDTIATFRRRFLKEIEGLFVKVLLLAREMGVLKLGTVALDGTKIHANASRHSALSYESPTGVADPQEMKRWRVCGRLWCRRQRGRCVLGASEPVF